MNELAEQMLGHLRHADEMQYDNEAVDAIYNSYVALYGGKATKQAWRQALCQQLIEDFGIRPNYRGSGVESPHPSGVG